MGSSSSSEVGLGEQAGRQGDPHPPAARELGHRPAEVGLAEAQPRQDLGGAGRRPVGVDLDQARVDVAHVFGLGGFQALQKLVALGIGFEHGIQQGHRRRRVLLVNRADAGGPRQADLAAAGRELAEDHLEQRRLAHAITPHEANLGVLGQGDRGVVEEAASPGVEDKIVDLQHEWPRALADDLPCVMRARRLASQAGMTI